MIVLKIQGGLGNQMFQYAFGRKIQQQTGQILILDISDFEKDKQRKFSLSHYVLCNDIEIDDSGKYNKIYDRRENLFIKIGTKFFPNISYDLFRKKGIYIWDFAKYKNIEVDWKQENLFFHGYWQGYDYFKDILPSIRKELIAKEEIKEELNEKNLELLKEIREENSICVHIRRGDFLLTSNKLNCCSNEYYLNAMQEVEKRIQNPKFYIFSDDINDVKANFNFQNRQVVYVENNNSDWEELLLMSECKHYIIANSTFSWWAAVLSDKQEKVVVAPKQWYSDKRDVSQLILDEWIVLDAISE